MAKTKKAKKLDIGETIYARDENLELVPREVEIDIEGNKRTIEVVPLLRGELRSLWKNTDEEGETTKDQDADIIVKCCKKPRYSADKKDKNWVGLLKPSVNRAVVNAILKASGLNIGMSYKEAYRQQEEGQKKS